MGQNPWLKDTYNRAMDPVMKTYRESTLPGVQSDYALSGRYGSNAFRTAMGNEQDKVNAQGADVASRIYGGAYEADRARQAAAAQGLTGAYAQDIQNRIGAGNFLSGVYDQGLQRQLYGAQQLGQLGQQDITNMLNAAGMVPGLGQADYADLDRQMQIGQMGQERAQSEQDLERQRYEYGQQAPYDWLQNYAQLIYGNPGSQSGFGTQTTTTKGGGGLLGQLLSAGTALGSAAMKYSDVRVKTDVERVGKLDSGLPVYRYRYKWGGPPEIGVMAQDAEKLFPQAVNDNNAWGIKTVDYRKVA
jgi:hypothetical protein